MTQPFKVTSITTGKDGTKTYWYNGAEPPKRTPSARSNTPRCMDPQKKRVYAAERAAFDAMFGTAASGHPVVELPELADVRRFVRKVQRSKWFRRLYPHVYMPIIVQDGRGLSRHAGNATGRVISIRRDSRCRWIVLHEIAHVVQTGTVQSHGPEYVATYLKLVRHFLGRAAWRALYDRCKECKVKMYRRRKTRTRRALTTEQRAALVERLAIARLARAVNRLPQPKASA